MKWIDSLEIAIALDETHPGADPLQVNFIELRERVLALTKQTANTVSVIDTSTGTPTFLLT